MHIVGFHLYEVLNKTDLKRKKSKQQLGREMAENGYMGAFSEKRSILYHDKGMRCTGISISQNCAGIRQHFLSYDIKVQAKKRG